MLDQLASDKSPKVRIAIMQAPGAVAGDQGNARDALHRAKQDYAKVHVRTSAAAALAEVGVYRSEAEQTLCELPTPEGVSIASKQNLDASWFPAYKYSVRHCGHGRVQPHTRRSASVHPMLS